MLREGRVPALRSKRRAAAGRACAAVPCQRAVLRLPAAVPRLPLHRALPQTAHAPVRGGRVALRVRVHLLCGPAAATDPAAAASASAPPAPALSPAPAFPFPFPSSPAQSLAPAPARTLPWTRARARDWVSTALSLFVRVLRLLLQHPGGGSEQSWPESAPSRRWCGGDHPAQAGEALFGRILALQIHHGRREEVSGLRSI